ncbi:MAG: M48 family metallopeptidase [Bacteroidota bacterium]|jgi:STE24 endopeptidase|nr:M48 family metallopeptidase [Bacteroidota bacterium]
MNPYAIIILVTVIATALLEAVAELLNLRALSPVLPEEFRDVYDEAAYARSQEYTRARTRFGFITATVDMALLLVFWFAGGFNALDLLVRALGWPELPTGLLYLSLLLTGMGVLSLPFRIYSTFVIEQRFGFNTTTVKTFVLDLLKGAALGALLGLPVLALVLWLFDAAGPLAWLYAWLAVTAFRIVMQYVAPTWIMPLFNTFTPLGEGPLRDEILAYAESVKFSLQGVFVMDGSKRSSKANAFFTGFGKNKRIALFDTLIEKHTAEELTAVVAHEIGHERKKHIVIGMLIGIGETGVMFFLLSLFVSSPALAAAFFMEHVSVYAGLVFFGLLYGPVSTLISLGMNALSRRHEYEADRYAVRTYRKPEAFVAALKKLTASNLSNVTPHPLYVFLNYSHPPLMERITQIRMVADEKTRHRGKMKVRMRDVL